MKKGFRKLTVAGTALTMALGVGAVTHNSLNLNAEAAQEVKANTSNDFGHINSFKSHVVNDRSSTTDGFCY